MSASRNFERIEVARAREYPPGRDFWAWWEVCTMHAHDDADMDRLARDAALYAVEKVKEAEKGPAGRRVSIVEAQWWFCQEISLGLEKQGAVKRRFQDVVLIPEPHRRTRQYATLHRLERAGKFEHADDIAAVFAAGWDVAVRGTEPRDAVAVVRAAYNGDDDNTAGALTRRELRGVLQDLVFPGVALALRRLERDVAQGRQLPHRRAREQDVVDNLLWIRGAMLDESDILIDASPAPFRPSQGSQYQPSESWETWDD